MLSRVVLAGYSFYKIKMYMILCFFVFSTRHPYIQGVYDVSELIIKRVTNPFHHNSFIYKWTENG